MPSHAPARLAGDDDPAGGVLEDAPDRFTLPSLAALWRTVTGTGRSGVGDGDGDGDGPNSTTVLAGSQQQSRL
jgi:hypothetical protein